MSLETFVAITGMKFYFGSDFIKIGQIVTLIKDPDNPHDPEAIKAVIPPIGKIGYVANSPNTVPRGCWSAGRIYDKFDQMTYGLVRFVLKETVILELKDQVEEWHVIKIGDNFRASLEG